MNIRSIFKKLKRKQTQNQSWPFNRYSNIHVNPNSGVDEITIKARNIHKQEKSRFRSRPRKYVNRISYPYINYDDTPIIRPSNGVHLISRHEAMKMKHFYGRKMSKKQKSVNKLKNKK